MATNIELGELIWKISGDTADIKKKLDQTDKATGKLGGSFKKFAAIAGGALATIGITKLTKELINAASEAEETQNKFNVVFQGLGDEAEIAVDRLNTGFGLSQIGAKKLLADTGDLLSSFGVTGEESLKLSANVAELGADLASFSNFTGGATGATEALTAALFGEAERAKQLGLALNVTEVEKYAESQGLVFKELTRAEKATLTYQLAVKQAKNSVGDFERSIGSFANQSRIAEGKVEDLKVSLGSNLLPIAGLGVKAFNEFGDSALDLADDINDFVTSAEGSEKIGEIVGNIVAGVVAFGEALKPVIDSIGDAFNSIIEPLKEVKGGTEGASVAFVALAGASQILSSGIRILGEFVGAIITQIVNLVDIVVQAGQAIGDFGKLLAREITFEEFKKSAAEAGGAVKNFALGTIEGISNIVSTVIDETTTLFDRTAETAQETADKFAETQEKTKNAVIESLQAQQEEKDEQAENDVEREEERLAQLDELRQEELEKELEANIKKAESVQNYVSIATSAFTSLVSSISSLSAAVTNAQIADLDRKLAEELENNGLAEKSTKDKLNEELSALQLELAAETDEEKKAAILEKINEQQKAIEREKIEADYQKKKAKLEYEGALAKWGLDLAGAIATAPLAIVNALNTGFGAGFPVGVVLGPVLAGVAATAAGIQIAAIASQRPQAPRFAEGGIVQGTQFSGDNILARVNSGEMILNDEQQKELFDVAGGNGSGGKITRIFNTIIMDGVEVAKNTVDLVNRGEFFIESRAVVS
jgi:hypothetical protein